MEVHTLGPMDRGSSEQVARAAGVDDDRVAGITDLAEGNPGAISVLAALVKRGHEASLAQIDRAGLRGPAIWVAFKDVCGQDFDLLVSRLAEDPAALARDVKATGRG